MALYTMPNMLTPLVNEQVLRESIFGIVYNAKYADTIGEWGAYLALYTMPNILTPLVNEQVLGTYIFGIVYNAKYADTTGE